MAVPDVDAIEVEVCPLLCLPPVMPFPLLGILLLHSTCGNSFRDSLEEYGTPANVVLLVSEVAQELKLSYLCQPTNSSSSHRAKAKKKKSIPR